jgi:lysophospholipase L1-like esterase
MPQIELVVLFFGANDSVLPDLGGFSRQFVPIDEYQRNLTAMAKLFQGMTNRDGSAPRVMIVGPPPVDDEAWHQSMIKKYSDGMDPATIKCNRAIFNVKMYNEAARAAAASVSAPFVDLLSEALTQSDVRWQELLSDGLHLSAAGSKLLHSLVRRELDRLPRGALKVESVAPQFPHHSQIDASNPEKLLRSVIPGSWLIED